jgi:nitrogen fixation NifU-like protein
MKPPSDSGPGRDIELDDLYRDIILDHYRNPRHRGRLPAPTVTREGFNPLCGDEVTIDLTVKGGRVVDVAYSGSGCSISQASASMMTEAVLGKDLDEVIHIIESFTSLMRGSDEVDPETLGDLEAMTGVRRFPVRVKCATLVWHVLDEALEEVEPE